MKKIITLIITIVILASCSTKINLVKRKYNKGYFVSVNKKHKQNENNSIAKNENHKPKITNENKEVINLNNTEMHVETSTINLNESTNALFNDYTTSNLNSDSRINFRESVIKTEVVKKHAFVSQVNKKVQVDKMKTKSGGGDSAIISIILCIFIPPLAVYLFKNSIDNNFWLDLVLTILGWLPGMIFAFLVCFGGVSI